MSVVAVILIILISIVAVGIYLNYTLKEIKKITVQENANCIGLDFKVIQCFLFPAGLQIPNSNYVTPTNAIYMVVERGYGGGKIVDLRFTVKDNNGETHVEVPVNLTTPGLKILADYKNFLEHSTTEAILTPINYLPTEIMVSPVVGESKTICDSIYPFETCVLIPST